MYTALIDRLNTLPTQTLIELIDIWNTRIEARDHEPTRHDYINSMMIKACLIIDQRKQAEKEKKQ